MKLKKAWLCILCLVIVFSTALVGLKINAEPDLPFIDVPDTWFTVAIESVYNEGIMKGKSDNIFDPTAKITRAEVVTAFSRVAITKTSGMGERLPFVDTISGQWYSDSVGWAAENGIVSGRGNGSFSPSDNITRAELASILTKFVAYMGISLQDNSKVDAFSDADTFDHWMIEPIETVRKNGLMQGSNGMFDPRGNATRAEIAQVINNLLPHTDRNAIILDGNTDYVIVIDTYNASAVDAAERLVWQIKELCGITLDIVDDNAESCSKEIIIGKTSRGNKINTSKMIRDEYEIKVDGSNVYIDAASSDGLYSGSVSFMNTCIIGDDMRFTKKSAEVEKFEYPVKELTINGHDISKYTVYYPITDNIEVISVANDIAYYIKEATGVDIDVKTGTSGNYGIILDITESDDKFDDSFSVRSVGTNIIINGHENRGVLYGAYDFLEQYIGVRYLLTGLDYIKPADKIDISNVEYTESPTFEFRRYCDKTYNNSDISIKHKEYRDLVWGSEMAHTLDSYDGDFSSQYVNQPCLTSDAVFDKVLDSIIYTLERSNYTKNESTDVISISPNDNSEWCKCNNCLSSYDKYGCISGTVIAFVNRIAEALHEDYPTLKIQTLAYSDTAAAPKNIKVHPNVIVQLRPVDRCNNHLPNHNCHTNKKIEQNILDWSKLVDDMYWWDDSYNTVHRGIMNPTHSYENVAGELQYLDKKGFNYIYLNGSDGETGEYYYMHTYLLVKCMWNPYLPESEYYEYMEDFLKGYYGNSWEYVYRNIMLLEEKYKDCLVVESTPYENMWHIKMQDYLADLRDNMTRAKLLAETKEKWDRIDHAEVQYEWIEIDKLFYDQIVTGNNDLTAIQQICRDFYAKLQKYGIRLSNQAENPSEIECFDRCPSDWGDFAFEPDALKHTPVIDPLVKPTCIDTGMSEGTHCKVCNKILIPQTVVPSTGHEYDSGVVTDEAFFWKNGIIKYSCTVDGCGFSYDELYSVTTITQTNGESLPDSEKSYTFCAISDIHLTTQTANEDFQRALTYAEDNCDFTCVCGDLTNSGSISEGVMNEMKLYKSIVENYAKTKPVYAISGNHETAYGTYVTDERIQPYTGQGLYYSFTVGNDVFIMLGHYGAYHEGDGGWRADEFLSVAEVQWLYETLEENRNKRCFIFTHVLPHEDGVGNPLNLYQTAPIWFTKSNGGKYDNGLGKSVINLIKHYKNVILFHGHSHTSLTFQELDAMANCSDTEGYRSVHIPSLAYPRRLENGVLINAYEESEGYIIDVYDDHIILNGWDFIDNDCDGHRIPNATYRIDTQLYEIEANTFVDSSGIIDVKSR